jgi:hypothetical protein
MNITIFSGAAHKKGLRRATLSAELPNRLRFSLFSKPCLYANLTLTTSQPET